MLSSNFFQILIIAGIILLALIIIGTILARLYKRSRALLHKDLKCKAPLIEPNLRRNLGKWST